MLPGKLYTPEMVLDLLKRRAWLILVPLGVVAAGTALWSKSLPDLYVSETTIQVVPQSISERLVQSTIEVRIEDRLPSIQQAIESRTRLEALIYEFDLYPEERRTMVMEDVVNIMRRDIHTEIVRSDAFSVSYVGPDPLKVMRVADRLGSLFIEQSLSYRHNLTEVTDDFLESQLIETRQALEAQERRLENYRRTYAGQLPTQVEANLQQMSAANAQVQQIVDSINQLMQRRLLLERQIADLERLTPDELPGAIAAGAAGTPPVDGPAGEVARAQAAVAALEARGLLAGHPDLEAARRALRDAQRKLAADTSGGSGPALSPSEAMRRSRLGELRDELVELDRQIADGRQRESRARAAADAAQARLDALPTRETEMIALMRDYDIIADTYKSLLQKKEEARISANLERRQVGEQFNVLDPARLAERPSSPNRTRMNLIGAMVGLALGIGMVGLLEYRDRSFRSDEDIVSVLGLPVLAVVPIMKSEADRRRALARATMVNLGCAALVTGCLAICVYVYVTT